MVTWRPRKFDGLKSMRMKRILEFISLFPIFLVVSRVTRQVLIFKEFLSCCVDGDMVAVGISLLVVSVIYIVLFLKDDDADKNTQKLVTKVTPSTLNHAFIIEGTGVHVALIIASKLQSNINALMNYLQSVPLPITMLIELSKTQLDQFMVICYSLDADDLEKAIEIRDKLLDHFLEVHLLDSTELMMIQDLFEGSWYQTMIPGVMWDENNHRFRFYLRLEEESLNQEEIVKLLSLNCGSFDVKKRIIVQVFLESSSRCVIRGIGISCDAWSSRRVLKLLDCASLVSILKPLKDLLIPLGSLEKSVIFRPNKLDGGRREEMSVEMLMNFFEKNDDSVKDSPLEEVGGTQDRDAMMNLFLESSNDFADIPESSSSDVALFSEFSSSSACLLDFQKDESTSLASVDSDRECRELEERALSSLAIDVARKSSDMDNLNYVYRIEDDGGMFLPNVRNLEREAKSFGNEHVVKLSKFFDIPLKTTFQQFRVNHDNYCLLRNSLLPSFTSEWLCQQQLLWSYQTIRSNEQVKDAMLEIFQGKSSDELVMWEKLVDLLRLNSKFDEDIEDNFITIHHFLIVCVEWLNDLDEDTIPREVLINLERRVIKFLDFCKNVIIS